MNLDELDRLHAAATAGEWESVLCDAPHVNDEVRMVEGPVTRAHGKKFVPVISRISPRADADFIAAAKNAWPEVSARLRAAEAEAERLRGALRSVRDDYDCDGVGTGGLECRHCLARAALGEP